MVQALPSDVQVLLRQPPASAAGTAAAGAAAVPAAVLLECEARDPRTAADVVLQLLAFTPAALPAAGAARLPPALASLHFSTSFFSCGPTLTRPCALAAAAAAQGGAGGARLLLARLLVSRHGGAAAAADACGGAGAGGAGAGLVLKFRVDGSEPGGLPPGADAAAAAFEAHMALCAYLAHHSLALDVWDADSLLQVRWVSARCSQQWRCMMTRRRMSHGCQQTRMRACCCTC